MTDAFNFVKSTAVVWGPFISGLVAAFIAAFIVHLLTQSREREKWILDCKKQEFKELLSAIAESYVTTLRVFPPFPATPFPTMIEPQEQQAQSLVENDSFRTMRDRLYIAEDLPLNRMSNDWISALKWYKESRDTFSLHVSYDVARTMIIEAANRSVPRSAIERLQFWKGILAKRRGKGKLAAINVKLFE